MRYDLNGLVVESDIPLAHAPPVAAQRPVDLEIRCGGERRVPGALESDTLLQDAQVGGRALYATARRADQTVLLRLYDRADFEISPDLRWVCAWRDPECSLEMLAIFVGGNLLSTVLALRGETVLHASAVEVEGAAVAFVADSGMGKSTLAALCCGRGARFVTDDVLRVRYGPRGEIRCWPGTIENRLRRGVAELLGGQVGPASRVSADGRTVWRPLRTTRETCRLAAVVLPHPDRTGSGLVLSRLRAGEAVLELSCRPRLIGWRDQRVLVQAFGNLSRLARHVPVHAAQVPWGPPFDGAVIDDLLERCLGAGVAPDPLAAPVSGPGTPPPAG